MTHQPKIVLASITVIVAVGLLALNPSMIGNVQAQMYDNQYGYDNNYYQDDNRYGYDKKEPKSTSVNIQKIKCVNSNINVNGIDVTQIPTNDLATAEASNEDGAATANTQNGHGLGDRLNVERNLVNVCVNVNANEQIKVEPLPEEPASLTVNKEIFGCTPNTSFPPSMNCRQLQDGSDAWLPCIGSSIESTAFCQNLPPNLFDIQVLEDQITLIDEFEGSTAGTTIQNLQPGTYTVNEIKYDTGGGVLRQDDFTQEECTNAGFTDGGIIGNGSPPLSYQICFEYEDEQGNDCSPVALAAGEDKTCIVKNYIHSASQIL